MKLMCARLHLYSLTWIVAWLGTGAHLSGWV